MAGSVFPPELVLRAIAALGMEGGAVVVDDIQKLADEAKASGVVTKTEGNTNVTVEGVAGELLEKMTKTITDLSAKVDSQAGVIASQAETIAKLLADFSAVQAVLKTSEANYARVTKSIGEVREILSGSVSAQPPEPEAMTDAQKEAIRRTAEKTAPNGQNRPFAVSPSGARIYPRE